MTESRSHTGRHRWGIMSRRPGLSTTMADSGTRRHDGLDSGCAEARHLATVARGGGRAARACTRKGLGGPSRLTASTTVSGVPPEIIRDAHGEHRIIASSRSTPDLAPGRGSAAEGLHEVVGLPSRIALGVVPVR